MKKLIVCILCLASTSVFAQVRLGLQGSFSSVNCWQTDGITGLPSYAFTQQMNAFQAGLVLDYEIGYSGFIIEPALVYAENGTNFRKTTGFNQTNEYNIGESDTYLRINSIRLPVNLLYKYAITNKWKVFAGIGAYVAKNLGGTEKGYYTQVNNITNAKTQQQINNTLKISSDMSYSPDGNSNVTPFDVGIDFLLGFSYKKFDFSASWNRGFTTVYHTRYENLGNAFWNFTVAYTIFGHERKPKL
jgi:hypothetical protein